MKIVDMLDILMSIGMILFMVIGIIGLLFLFYLAATRLA